MGAGHSDGASVDANDGSFYMPFEKWFDIFTHVFIAMDLGVFGEPEVSSLLSRAAQASERGAAKGGRGGEGGRVMSRWFD